MLAAYCFSSQSIEFLGNQKNDYDAKQKIYDEGAVDTDTETSERSAVLQCHNFGVWVRFPSVSACVLNGALRWLAGVMVRQAL